MLTAGSVLITPRQLGPISGMPADRTFCLQLPLQLDAFAADLFESGRNDDHRLNLLGNGLVHHFQNPRRGHDHDGQIHLARHAQQVGIAVDTQHVAGLRIDRIDGAVELIEQQITEDVVAHRAGTGRGADHGDRGRFENGIQFRGGNVI